MTYTMPAARRAVAALALLLAAAPLAAQSVAARVAAAPDGEVRLAYATRSGTCGDGKNVVSFGRTTQIWPGVESHGAWRDAKCVPGPARVALVKRAGKVASLRTYVGGGWAAGGERVTDLGTVAPAEASTWLLSLAREGEVTVAKAALLPAAIAEGTTPAPALLAIGRDAARPMKVRRTAVHLAGAVGDASLVPELVAMATSGDRTSGKGTAGGKKRDDGDQGVATAAVLALRELPDDAGMPTVARLATTAEDARVRKDATFWLGESEDPAMRRTAREIALNAREDESVRSTALFALGHGDETTEADRAWLREAFARLTSEKLRDQVLMGIAQGGSAADLRWVLDRARDESLPVHTRRSAIFWAGQGNASVDDLVALYRGLKEAQVKEHAIFALSQREESAAIDALVDIARNDEDRAMRRKALFWLGQKDDPRVTKLITDLVIK